MSKLQNTLVRTKPLDSLARTLNSFDRRHNIDQVFRDWVAMCAYSISNALDKTNYDMREASYMAIVKGYSKEEAATLADMMSMLIMCLEHSMECPFQQIIQRLELGSASHKKRLGQFMTPFNISYMMAKMTLAPHDKLREQIDRKGFITMAEPCCGAGGMVLAFAKALEDEGINYQRQLHVMAQDIDPLCVQMTYVSTSLVGIPAVVMQGNSLSDKVPSDFWYTPFHILHGWTDRLKAHADRQGETENSISIEPAADHDGFDGALEWSTQVAPDGTTELADRPIRPGITKWRIIQDQRGTTMPP
jgi:hypothetical protein